MVYRLDPLRGLLERSPRNTLWTFDRSSPHSHGYENVAQCHVGKEEGYKDDGEDRVGWLSER